MNVLMCRRLVAALYQSKSEMNMTDDKEKRTRQPLPDYVPNQFVVIYGMRSLAVKNINEFLYGVRAGRMRTAADGSTEPEPVLHYFWRATHHGVPFEERLPPADFDFFIDLLSAVASAVGEEHTLKCKGTGAFWNLYGSMHELELPVFVLINVVTNLFSATQPELIERLRKAIVKRAAEFCKASKKGEPPSSPGPYKRMLLGSEALDSRGHLPLETFLRLAIDAGEAQRKRDAAVLESILTSWMDGAAGSSFDVFADMMAFSVPDMGEDQLISLYQMATSGDDPDKIHMALIVTELRKAGIILKRNPGKSTVGDGVGSMEDLKAATLALRLFAPKPEKKVMGYKFASKWKKVGMASRATDLLRDLDKLAKGPRGGFGGEEQATLDGTLFEEDGE